MTPGPGLALHGSSSEDKNSENITAFAPLVYVRAAPSLGQ